jgi:hypothetical protein
MLCCTAPRPWRGGRAAGRQPWLHKACAHLLLVRFLYVLGPLSLQQPLGCVEAAAAEFITPKAAGALCCGGRSTWW